MLKYVNKHQGKFYIKLIFFFQFNYEFIFAYIFLLLLRFTIGDCAGGHRADNRDKNRDVLCVPRKLIFAYFTLNEQKKNNKLINFLFYIINVADNFRPYLTSFQGNAFTDYINAVFVDVRITQNTLKNFH